MRLIRIQFTKAGLLTLLFAYLFKYSTYYSGKEPEFKEGDIFRIIVPLDAEMDGETTQGGGQGGGQDGGQGSGRAADEDKLWTNDLPEVETNIIQLIDAYSDVSIKDMSELLGLKISTIKYHVQSLKDKGVLSREGSQQKGHWVVNPDVEDQ